MLPRGRKRSLWRLGCVLVWLWAAGSAAADTEVTIVATVSDGYQLVGDDGQPYEVENTAKGNDLVVNHVGRKVEVVGTVVDEIDYKIITVTAFRLLEEE